MIDINDLKDAEICEKCKCIFMPNDRECPVYQHVCNRCNLEIANNGK